MSTWVPEDLPPDLALGPEPAVYPGAEPSHVAAATPMPEAPTARAIGTTGVSDVFRATGWAIPPPELTPGTVSPRATSQVRIVVIAVIAGLLLAVLSGLLLWRELNHEYSPGYVGTPVEATDVDNGLTAVGFDNSVAYAIKPLWVDLAAYAGAAPEAQAMLDESFLVGAHFTGDPHIATTEFVLVIALEEGFPRRSLTELHEMAMDRVRADDTQTVIRDTSQFTTPNGLRGYVGDHSGPGSGGQLLQRIAVLGNGSSVVLVIWGSPNPTINEAAYAEFIQSVRIDG